MKQKPTSEAQHSRSHLFMVRVWFEDLGEGRSEWRGQVKHVLSGEVRYFRDWKTFLEFLQKALTKDASKNDICPSPVDEGDDNDDR